MWTQFIKIYYAKCNVSWGTESKNEFPKNFFHQQFLPRNFFPKLLFLN